MLALTLVVLSQIGAPQGVHLLDDAPLFAQADAPPPLLPSAAPASEAQVSAQQLQVDLDALKRQRPGLGGGIALVSAGGTVALLGVLYLAVSSAAFFGGGLNPFLIVGAVCLGVGLPLVAIGVWLLYNRMEERKRIDDETKSLREQLQRMRPTTPQQPRQYAPPPSDIPPPQVRGPDTTILMAQF
ncbi:MAG: hypothetical protein Q8L48_21185 [Archangium sp.]|nr:hypothetical protein [Archangium sp.]